MNRALAFASSLALCATAATVSAPLVSAQPGRHHGRRHVDHVSELSSSSLSGLLSSQRHQVERCASSRDTDAFVAEVRARVSPGPAPSTMYNAQVSLTVRSRPRDARFERCVSSAIRDALRHSSYAVARSVSARQTLRIADRPEPPPPQPTRPFSESEVQQVLRASRGGFQRCLEMAGVPEQVTLRVAVEADGRLVLTSADLPPGSSPHALGCLARRTSSLRVSGHPARRVTIVHDLGVRSRAF